MSEERKPTEIREIKCTCHACGNVWFYGKQEIAANKLAATHNLGKSMMCCGGCAPAVLIPEKRTINLDKCPKCGSAAVVKETVIHHV
jgi:predicted nucleic-acid-binding Zn-ribbon protein